MIYKTIDGILNHWREAKTPDNNMVTVKLLELRKLRMEAEIMQTNEIRNFAIVLMVSGLMLMGVKIITDRPQELSPAQAEAMRQQEGGNYLGDYLNRGRE